MEGVPIRSYYLQLGYKPKWILIFCIVLGVLLGALLIFAGYQTDQDLLLVGLSVMIIMVALGVIIYFVINRMVKNVESETGLDLMGLMDTDFDSTRSGMAEVLSAEATGEYVNNQPEFILLLRITASGQDSFEVEHKQAFSDESSLAVGAQIPVMFDKNRNVQLIGLGDIGQYKVIDPKNL
ncbi:MAG: hypothetical protein A4E25_01695 [Methanobacterium sp. PtaB.Bin024]|nr:MAG: hypothetical protein A4E25_01695 [Methanobacterium sp. PtaB.Bin024]